MPRVTYWTSERKGKPTVEWFAEVIQEVMEAAKNEERVEIEKRKATSSLENLETMVIPVKLTDIEWNFPNKFGFRENYPSQSNIDQVVLNAGKYLDSIEQKIEEEHSANIPAIENNQLILNGLLKMMDKFGIKRSWSEFTYSSSRSRTKKWIEKQAEWPSEIRKCISISDGYELKKTTIQKYREQIIKFQEVQNKKIADIVKQQETDRKQQENLQILAQFRVKYGFDWSASWSDVLDKILSKNKYLHLAYWMERNRGDWSEGYDYAQIGIDGFTVETPVDQQIRDEIYDLAYNSDGFYDGRCFRDCEWNYSVLYGMVNDEELMNDFNIAREKDEEKRY